MNQSLFTDSNRGRPRPWPPLCAYLAAVIVAASPLYLLIFTTSDERGYWGILPVADFSGFRSAEFWARPLNQPLRQGYGYPPNICLLATRGKSLGAHN
jgi:hypothetical protein